MTDLLKQLGEFLYVILFIIAVVLFYSLINRKYNNNGKSIKYYIKPSNKDIHFRWETSQILKNSSINSTHDIDETLNYDDADILIELTPRNEMEKMFYKKIEFYPGTNDRIWFSFTTQRPKPSIFIDEVNWMYGVKQSGMTLSEYRKYIIQHEFMHALGYDHQPCDENTAPDGICPVLYQATRGCPKGFKCGFDVTKYDYNKKIKKSYF